MSDAARSPGLGMGDLDEFECVRNDQQTLLAVENGPVCITIAVEDGARLRDVDDAMEASWDYAEDVVDPTTTIASRVDGEEESP